MISINNLIDDVANHFREHDDECTVDAHVLNEARACSAGFQNRSLREAAAHVAKETGAAFIFEPPVLRLRRKPVNP